MQFAQLLVEQWHYRRYNRQTEAEEQALAAVLAGPRDGSTTEMISAIRRRALIEDEMFAALEDRLPIAQAPEFIRILLSPTSEQAELDTLVSYRSAVRVQSASAMARLHEVNLREIVSAERLITLRTHIADFGVTIPDDACSNIEGLLNWLQYWLHADTRSSPLPVELVVDVVVPVGHTDEGLEIGRSHLVMTQMMEAGEPHPI